MQNPCAKRSCKFVADSLSLGLIMFCLPIPSIRKTWQQVAWIQELYLKTVYIYRGRLYNACLLTRKSNQSPQEKNESEV
jgi:hypothetical protein